MIKSITTVRVVSNGREFAALADLLDSLGLERGKHWKATRSQGLPFTAPLGKVEIIEGKEPLPADLWVEVTDLDSVRSLLTRTKTKFISDISDTGWNSRLMVVEPAKGIKLAFWQKDEPEGSVITGDLNATGMRFGIVVSRWNSFITERLLQGALDALRRSGCHSKDITVVRVPGAFEIPSQSRTLAETGEYDAIITLGCLIRGDTTHYEHISTEATRGIGQSAQETGVPHAYGVLTCENLEQALDRAGLKAGNKGFEAAMSAIEMVSLKRKTASKKPQRRKTSTKRGR
jgi:6,7-dimethyl-8-ribityllumazine synthase